MVWAFVVPGKPVPWERAGPMIMLVITVIACAAVLWVWADDYEQGIRLNPRS